MSGYTDKGSSAYPTMSAQKVGKRDFEYSGGAPGSLTSGSDGWQVSNSNKRITLSADNGEKGDFIRVVTRAATTNNAPVGNNDAGYINEDATLSVTDGASANDATPDASGEHTGDVLLNDTAVSYTHLTLPTTYTV